MPSCDKQAQEDQNDMQQQIQNRHKKRRKSSLLSVIPKRAESSKSTNLGAMASLFAKPAKVLCRPPSQQTSVQSQSRPSPSCSLQSGSLHSRLTSNSGTKWSASNSPPRNGSRHSRGGTGSRKRRLSETVSLLSKVSRRSVISAQCKRTLKRVSMVKLTSSVSSQKS